MHSLVFGHSFAELVALILLPGLAFYFLNKKKSSVRRKAENVDPGRSSSMTAPIETNSGASSLSPTETNNNGASGLSPTESNNGTSSWLTASSRNSYEVFLSSRGKDIREGFASHLYDRLIEAGIYVFRDDDKLRQGENIGPELLAAITNSKILIPILSVNYGTSSWCLDELVQIMECKNKNGQIVLPIFYKVKPANVGHLNESFGDAFHKREKRLLERSSFDPTTLEKWKQALLGVSMLKGYEAKGQLLLFWMNL